MGFWQTLRQLFTGKKTPEQENLSTTGEHSLQPSLQPSSAEVASEINSIISEAERSISSTKEQASENHEEEHQAEVPPKAYIPPLEVPLSTYRSPTLTHYGVGRYQLSNALKGLLEEAKVIDQSRMISADLLVLALEEGLIPSAKALQLARSQSQPTLRADALTRLLMAQGSDALMNRVELYEEAWQAAEAIPAPRERAKRFAALKQPKAESAALMTAQTIRDTEARIKTLAHIGAWRECLTALHEVGSEWECSKLLIEMADDLPEPFLSDALKIAQSLDENPRYMTEALSALIPHLPSPLINELRQWVWRVKEPSAQVLIGIALARGLSGDILKKWVQQLREVAEKEQDASKRIELWSKLSPYLPPEERQKVLSELVTLARTIKRPLYQAEALGRIALQLPLHEARVLFDEASQVAAKKSDMLLREPLWGAWAKGLAKESHEPAIHAALRMLAQIQNEYMRVSHLRKMAPHLSSLSPTALVAQLRKLLPSPLTRVLFWQDSLPYPPAHLAEIAKDVTQLDDLTARRIGLVALAPHLPDKRHEMVRQALATTEQQRAPSHSIGLLAALARKLPTERSTLLNQAQKKLAAWDKDNQAYILANMVGQLGAAAPPELLRQAVSAIKAISNPSSQSLVWLTLVAEAPPSQQRAWAEEALAVALTLNDSTQRNQRIIDCLPYLADKEIERIWQQVNKMGNENQLAALLEQLAPRMSPALIEAALERLLALSKLHMRVLAAGLSALTPYFSDEQLELATLAAQEIRFPAPRIQALASLAARQDEATRRQTLADLLSEARKITLPSSRGEALGHLAAHLPEAERPPLLKEALGALSEIADEGQQAHFLLKLVGISAPELLDEMVYHIQQVKQERLRLQLLIKLLPQVPATKIGALLPLVSTFEEIYDYNQLLSALIPKLPATLLIEALLLIRAHPHDSVLQQSLAAFAPRWRLMQPAFTVNRQTELVLTLEAFAKGGTVPLISTLTTLLDTLEAEGGNMAVVELARLMSKD